MRAPAKLDVSSELDNDGEPFVVLNLRLAEFVMSPDSARELALQIQIAALDVEEASPTRKRGETTEDLITRLDREARKP